LVAKPEPGETLDLVAIVTSVILTRVCAVAGLPEMANLRYGSVSAIGNRVTIVTCGTFADSVPALRRVRRWDRTSRCARQVQSVHTKAPCPASIFQAAKSIAYAPRASSAESDHLHPRHKQTPHRLHQNVASSIQSSLGRLSEPLAHLGLPLACQFPQRAVLDFLTSTSRSLFPREQAQEASSPDRDCRQMKMFPSFANPLQKSAFGFECCQQRNMRR
jgi:hypothetical protein